MDNIKKCRQCGEIKPAMQFRPYYGGRKGTYTICKACERLNSRYKYLFKKLVDGTESSADAEERTSIEALYEAQRKVGLKPPSRRNESSNRQYITEMLAQYVNKAYSIPSELQHWLDAELTDVPEYYLDTVYEDLLKRYRPVIRVDANTLTPMYDETHTKTLNQILDRFNDYEDKYYGGDEQHDND